MKRSHLLILICVLIAAAAVALRVRDGLRTADRQAADPTTSPVREQGDDLASPERKRGGDRQDAGPTKAVPHDYVAHPAVVEDERTAGPRRVVSMAPSITEVICALGLRDRLVGRTQYCVYPPGLDSVPTVGALMDTNYEFIKSLNPDVVFVTENSKELRERFAALHIRCEPVPHNSIADVSAAIRRVGELCGRPRTAAALTAAIEADLAALQRNVAAKGGTPRRALVILGELPVPPSAIFVAGPNSFLEGLLTMAGGSNAAREVLKTSHGEIPLEKLIQLDPDVILEFRDNPTPQLTEEMYRSWAAVGQLRAIRDRQVRTVVGLEWLSAGPRIAIELQRFITALDSTR